MAIEATHKEVSFGVGDVVRLHQVLVNKSAEDLPAQAGKGKHTQVFEGSVIGIRGSGMGKSIIVRRIGEAGIGIEQIFPLASPILDKIEVVRLGKRGVRHAKIYYTRGKSKREIEKIYSRARRRELAKQLKPKAKKIVRRTNPASRKASRGRR
jgi:ribosomal protein L19